MVFSFVCLAAILFLLSVRVLPERAVLLYGDEIRENLLEQENVSDDQIDLFVQTRLNALNWRANGQTFGDLAMAFFERARRKNFVMPDVRKDLEESIEWQRSALAVAPADTYGWARLTYSYLQVDGLSQRAADALTRSMETAPYEPQLMLSRLEMAVSLLDKLDPETRASLPSMIRALWKLYPENLALSARDRHYISLFESAMADDPVSLRDFRGFLEAKDREK